MSQLLYAGANYFTTNLTTVNGIDSTQTTGIILNDVSGVTDLSKPSVIAIDWNKNTDGTLDTTKLEFIEYTSIDSGTKELQGVTRGIDGYAAKAHDFGVNIVFPVSISVINRLVDKVADTVVVTPQAVTIADGAGTVITRVSGTHYINFSGTIVATTALASTMSDGDSYLMRLTFSGTYTVTFTGVKQPNSTDDFTVSGDNGNVKDVVIQRLGSSYTGRTD